MSVMVLLKRQMELTRNDMRAALADVLVAASGWCIRNAKKLMEGISWDEELWEK